MEVSYNLLKKQTKKNNLQRILSQKLYKILTILIKPTTYFEVEHIAYNTD